MAAGTTEVWTPLAQSAADRVRELSDGFAVEVKKVAGRTVDERLFCRSAKGQKIWYLALFARA